MGLSDERKRELLAGVRARRHAELTPPEPPVPPKNDKPEPPPKKEKTDPPKKRSAWWGESYTPENNDE